MVSRPCTVHFTNLPVVDAVVGVVLAVGVVVVVVGGVVVVVVVVICVVVVVGVVVCCCGCWC